MAVWRSTRSTDRKLDAILQGIERQMRGDFTRNRKGAGKGGGKGMGGGTPKPFQPDPCGCCGKRGHLKSDCRFLGKSCNSCGVQGHLAAVCWGGKGGNTNGTTGQAKPPPPKPDPAKDIVDLTQPPWTCHQCYVPCEDPSLKRCPRVSCTAKRLVSDKPAPDPKALIGKDALKIIDSAEKAADDATADEGKKAEIEELKKTVAQAKKYGWSLVQENAERRLATLRPLVTSPGLDVAKDTRTVISDRVRILHTHEAKCASLEAKCEKATEAIAKHKTAKEEARKVEDERHRKRVQAIDDDFAQMIRVEEETIKESTEALKLQKTQYEEADQKINGFMAKQLPQSEEPSITPAMIDTELIAQHLMQDATLAGIIDLQAEGVAKSLCSLLNLIVDSKNKKEAESDMELDENEEAATRDHAEAQRQMDGTSATPRRRRGKQQARKEEMDQTETTAGKRDAEAADAEKPPPPKVEKFDMTVGDDPKKDPANIEVPKQ